VRERDCVRERGERDYGCVPQRVCVCVIERECLRESVCVYVCAWGASVCVCERERVRDCVCERERVRDCVCERER